MRAARRTVVVLCLLVGAATAQELPRVTLRADQALVAEVLADLARRAGLELKPAGRLPETRISLVLRRVTVNVALDEICRRIDYTWRLDGRQVQLAPRSATATPATVDGVPATVTRDAQAAVTALRQAPDDAQRLRRLGTWLRDLRPDWQRAVRERLPELWRGGQLDGPGALLGARVLAQLGDLDGALRLLPVARREAALEGSARRLAALFELQRGTPARALVEATLASRLDPNDGAAAALQAEAQLYLGRQEEALAEATAAATRWPERAEVLATLGNILRHEVDAAGEADRVLQRALERAPGLPDALFGLAVLAARDPRAKGTWWDEFLRAEPFTLRADRVRQRLAAVASTTLAERGGPVWDVTRDGDRCLYTLRFRKELEIVDTHGTGLALQVTDQDADKVGASLSPNEQHLAWIVGSNEGDRLFWQQVNASGQHQELLTTEKGVSLRRTTWSPDGHWLLVTERRDTPAGPAVRLRCWDATNGQETTPPPPCRLPGLGDVTWRPDGWLVGTVLAEHRQVVVAIPPTGEPLLLRPAAGLRTYTGPTLDSARTRLVCCTNDLVAAPADGSEGGEVPVLSAVTGSETAVWIPQSDRLLVSLSNLIPTAIDCGGLRPLVQWLTQVTPLHQYGPQAPRYEFRLRNLTGAALALAIKAAVVADDGGVTWQDQVQLTLARNKPGNAVFVPADARPGVHWLRVETTIGQTTDRVRWYRYEVTAPAAKPAP